MTVRHWAVPADHCEGPAADVRRLPSRFALILAMAAATAAGSGTAAETTVVDGDITAVMSEVGSSSRESRRRALAAIPLHRIAEPQRRAVEQCLRSTTIYRRLPAETFPCDPALLDFSLGRPEAIVDIWRVLGISRLVLDPSGPGQWRLSDGYGTTGVLRLVHREEHREERGEERGRAGLLVLYGRGGYAGPLSPRNLTGSCVLLVQHRAAADAADGRPRQTVQIDAFVDMDGAGLEIVTRTLHPLIVRSAASNLHEICIFLARLSQAAGENPEGVAALAERLSRTAPEDRRTLAAIARSAAAEEPGPDDPAAGRRLQSELAARWMPAESLDALDRRAVR